MQTVDVIKKFSKTPLKHRMSKYLLEYLLDEDDLLKRIVFVTNREALPDIMVVAQAGAEGTSFELELGAKEREEVSLVNGRLVKQTKKTRAIWIHDPVQALEALRKFTGKLHVQFIFVEEPPEWYQRIAVPAENVVRSDFAALVRAQIDLAVLAILLKHEIDEALRTNNKELFLEKAKLYKQVSDSCLVNIT